MRENNESFALQIYLEGGEETIASKLGYQPEKESESNSSEKILPAVLASDPDTAPGVLAVMAVTADICVLEKIAANPSTPSVILEELAEHCEPIVREAVADNQMTPLSILCKLATDPDPDIRYALAENHNAPLAVIEQLCRDENPYVSTRAHRTAERQMSFWRKGRVCDITRIDQTRQQSCDEPLDGFWSRERRRSLN